tara:strand:+ start:18853 stop:19041 length:189 start_codon:yes stop_codon:yes gene_type:complete
LDISSWLVIALTRPFPMFSAVVHQVHAGVRQARHIGLLKCGLSVTGHLRRARFHGKNGGEGW